MVLRINFYKTTGQTKIFRGIMRFKIILLSVLLSPFASAQVPYNARVNALVHYHATVGTTSAVAIPSVSVIANLLSWQICADSLNASYLAVGVASDVDTDGVRLAAGDCFVCPSCTATTLTSARAKGGAAAQGYSVIQFRETAP
jgi:hypothetical protein